MACEDLLHCDYSLAMEEFLDNWPLQLHIGREGANCDFGALRFTRTPPSSYKRTQNDYTHTFYYLGINFPIAQDICYTGLSGRNDFM